MKNKVGKKTPVWKNIHTGEIVCGATIYEATGCSWFSGVEKNYERVTSLPREKRIVICAGYALPENDYSLKVASTATKTGPLYFKLYRREFSTNVLYIDTTRVIIDS